MSVPTDISEYLFPSGFVPSEVLWQNQIRADPPGNTCYQYDNNSSAEFYPECYWFWPISSYWSVCLLLGLSHIGTACKAKLRKTLLWTILQRNSRSYKLCGLKFHQSDSFSSF